MEIIYLRYAKNYRDLGGIPTVDGRKLKSRMLIRGTKLHKLHKKDVELLKSQYRLSTILDLRTLKEAEECPDAELEGVKYILMPVLDEARVGISHEKKVHSFKSLEQMPSMEQLYVSMVTDDCQENLVKILRTILLMPEEDFSVVFHCTAGKDRTGILAALILAFLGVDRNLIIKDYLYTNKVTAVKARFTYIALLLVKFSHRLAVKVSRYFLAKEDYIETALSSLENEFGSLELFFKTKLNFSDEETERIRNKFLEKAD